MTFEVFVHLWLLYLLFATLRSDLLPERHTISLLVLNMGIMAPSSSHQKKGNVKSCISIILISFFHYFPLVSFKFLLASYFLCQRWAVKMLINNSTRVVDDTWDRDKWKTIATSIRKQSVVINVLILAALKRDGRARSWSMEGVRERGNTSSSPLLAYVK